MEYQIKNVEYDEATQLVNQLKAAKIKRLQNTEVNHNTDDDVVNRSNGHLDIPLSSPEVANIMSETIPIIKDKDEVVKPSSSTSTAEDIDSSKLRQLLIPEYIEKELAPNYTKTFLNHLNAYKLAFKECTYVKNCVKKTM